VGSGQRRAGWHAGHRDAFNGYCGVDGPLPLSPFHEHAGLGRGAYYILSRSLGVETGAAVGIPFFIAKAIAVSFYISGFSESIVALSPSLPRFLERNSEEAGTVPVRSIDGLRTPFPSCGFTAKLFTT